MWNEYIHTYSMVCSCIGLLLLAYWIAKDSNVSSSTISFIVWVCASVFVFGIEPVLYKLTGNVTTDRYVWYCSFAAINLFSVYLITIFHRINGIKISRDSAMICLSLLALAAVQVARLVDKEILGTFIMNDFYKSFIPALNTITWSFIAVMTYSRKSIEHNSKGNS